MFMKITLLYSALVTYTLTACLPEGEGEGGEGKGEEGCLNTLSMCSTK